MSIAKDHGTATTANTERNISRKLSYSGNSHSGADFVWARNIAIAVCVLAAIMSVSITGNYAAIVPFVVLLITSILIIKIISDSFNGH